MNSLILFKRKDSNGAGDERLIGEWLGGQAMATVRAIPPQYKELQLKEWPLIAGSVRNHRSKWTAWQHKNITMKNGSKQIQTGSLPGFILMLAVGLS